jgi:quercetin dioxygenase-like cupin family protein
MADAVVKVEEIQLPRILLRILIDGQGSGASLTMFEMEVAPGGAMPIPHHHVGFDETAYCMAGRLRMIRDGQAMDVRPGETVHIPRGMVHAFENPFEETAKVLVVITPGVFGAPFFRDMRELMSGGGPPDPKRAAEVMMRHGLVPAVPPPQ